MNVAKCVFVCSVVIVSLSWFVWAEDCLSLLKNGTCPAYQYNVDDTMPQQEQYTAYSCPKIDKHGPVPVLKGYHNYEATSVPRACSGTKYRKVEGQWIVVGTGYTTPGTPCPSNRLKNPGCGEGSG
jgi:hypothetical protein